MQRKKFYLIPKHLRKEGQSVLKQMTSQQMSVLQSSFNMPVPKVERIRPFPKAPSQFCVPPTMGARHEIRFQAELLNPLQIEENAKRTLVETPPIEEERYSKASRNIMRNMGFVCSAPPVRKGMLAPFEVKTKVYRGKEALGAGCEIRHINMVTISPVEEVRPARPNEVMQPSAAPEQIEDGG